MIRAVVISAALIAVLASSWAAGSALFTDSPGIAANSFTSDTLNPPTAPSASVAGADVNLSWTATVDTYAAGHRVLRGTASGGPYTQIAQVTPRTTTTHTDINPGFGTFYYVIRAYFQNWESANSTQVSAAFSTNTGYLSCSANAAVTTGSGDNNGFETNPANACSNDAARADDTNSGTDTTASCTGTGKDRHLYYNYGFSIPAGAAINGIDVRLDGWADSASGTPFYCLELSWNGGATWTAVKTTTTLTNSEVTYTLGSVSDLWGRTWSVGDFSNANFRVRITSVATNSGRDFRLDWLAVRVTYTP